MKSAVFFYSFSGKTRIIAEKISEALNSDLIEVEELNKRTTVGAYVFGGHSALTGKCSDIKPIESNPDNYDLLIIGTPVWASNPAPAINSLISKIDLKGKEVILYVTYKGGGNEKALEALENKISQKGGKTIRKLSIITKGDDMNNRIADMVKEISNYTKK